MTDTVPLGSTQADLPITRERDLVTLLLGMSGRPEDVVGALIAMDRDIYHWRRGMIKGEGLAALLKSAGLGLELAEFQALLAVHRLTRRSTDTGPGHGEVTVGALAQDMDLDPSRASRLATKLIAGGYLRRAVAQSDARRAVLELTELGADTLAVGHTQKWARYVEVLRDWTDDEISAFAGLLHRYVTAMGRLNAMEQETATQAD